MLLEGLALGARGFLLKNTDPAQLLHGIRLVAGGEELLSPGLARRLVAQIAERLADITTNSNVSPTSPIANARSSPSSRRA